MNQLKFEEFENMPSEFLDTVSDKEFFYELEQAPPLKKNTSRTRRRNQSKTFLAKKQPGQVLKVKTIQPT